LQAKGIRKLLQGEKGKTERPTWLKRKIREPLDKSVKITFVISWEWEKGTLWKW